MCCQSGKFMWWQQKYNNNIISKKYFDHDIHPLHYL